MNGEYQHSSAHYADFYNVSTRTIQNWRAKNAPFGDDEAMKLFIMAQKSRSGVGKYNKRASAPILTAEPAEAELSVAELDHWWETVAKPIWERHKAERSQCRRA